MCGIAGIVAMTPEGERERAVNRMLDAQRHRGPDASGRWSDQACTLGHRRLSIIDLSPAAGQPFVNEDGSVAAVVNGEVYNFPELRSDLERRGHLFRSRSDAEVVLHGYEEWGDDLPLRLRGMFAFGVWDGRTQRLLLARDRLGKKPLHYAQIGDRFLFASELQALVACPLVPRAVDADAVDRYLTYGYVPAPATAFRGVSKLPPAHVLILERTGDALAVRTRRYWSLERTPKLALPFEDASAALRAKVEEAVRIRLASDVPLGAFLSGGIDSSTVVGVMAQASGRPVKTFSIGFDDARYDERDAARRVAARWGTEHEQFVVRPDATTVLPMLVRHFGEPFADSSAIPTFYVSHVTRQRVTVALTGDGGDESFAGYDRYRAERLASRMAAVPGAPQLTRTMAGLVPRGGPRTRVAGARRFLTFAGEARPDRYAAWIGASTGHLDVREKRRLYAPEFRSALDGLKPLDWMRDLFMQAAALDPVDAAMSVDVASYLPGDLLVKTDITSMANGLEARCPLLDHEVMELAARLPTRFKLRGNHAKHILLHAFRDVIPPENQVQAKRGFGVPIDAWLRGPLQPLVDDVLLAPSALARGYFRADALRKLATAHASGRVDAGAKLWSLLVLELWHRTFIDR